MEAFFFQFSAASERLTDLQTGNLLCFGQPSLLSCLSRLSMQVPNLRCLRNELVWLQQNLSLLGSPVVLCHNDLLCKNIIYNQREGEYELLEGQPDITVWLSWLIGWFSLVRVLVGRIVFTGLLQLYSHASLIISVCWVASPRIRTVRPENPLTCFVKTWHRNQILNKDYYPVRNLSLSLFPYNKFKWNLMIY